MPPRLLRPVRQDLLARVAAPRAPSVVAVRWPRMLVATLLALVFPAALLLAAWLAPAEFREAMTSTRNVHDLFARFVSAIATASSIAVSIAALTLRRELRGIHHHDETLEQNDEFRAGIRERLEADTLPMDLPHIFVDLLRGIAKRADEARALAGAHGRLETSGVPLDAFLEATAQEARRTADALVPVLEHPDRVHLAVLDHEHEVTMALLRRYRRDERLPQEVREALDRVDGLMRDFVVAARYLKTLDLQWGLSRMSHGILLSAVPAIAIAAAMVLTYGSGAVDALGSLGASALVCAALAACLFPLTVFVSYLLRFVFVNQHTLPTEGFVLGPEEKRLVRAPGPRTRPHA